MKIAVICTVLLLVLGAFVIPEDDPKSRKDDTLYRRVSNNSFRSGERIEYRLHYGLITAGEGVVETSPDLYRINNRPCYRTTISGRTSGTFDIIYKVRNTWRSYIDTGALVTQRFYWNVNEGKYHKEETVFFDHANKKIRSEEQKGEAKNFEKMPENIQDIISGYYYLRTLDFTKFKEGDVIPVVGFFDDNYFDFKIRYRGKEVIRTKFGKIRCHRLTPVMPKNELFDGDSSVRFYISDDENKIPVKVEADMFIGAIEVDIKKYENLRHPLKTQ
jgi:hypothetical protein